MYLFFYFYNRCFIMLKISSYILYYRILYELLNIFYILLKKSFLKTKKMIKDLFKNED